MISAGFDKYFGGQLFIATFNAKFVKWVAACPPCALASGWQRSRSDWMSDCKRE